jgi:hypothetical protein
VKGHCTFRNFFSTYQRGRLIRHQNLFGILADIPLSSGCTSGGRGSFQSVKLQRPDRDTVCSHSEKDATANVEPILIHAVSSELVKIALPFYPAVGLTKSALRLTRNDQSQDDGSVQEARCVRPDEQFRPVSRQNPILSENGLTRADLMC